MSMKENDEEMKQLRNTIKLQQQSFQQSAEVVKTLKNGLLLQHKMQEHFRMDLTAMSVPNLAASLKCIEVLFLYIYVQQ